ncbi:MAG: DUF362 domain-containing protein [Candidatus Eremiobacteraeota bacterium]|nr:DUF362 domain-containing protein [Candidatus Eremiobacteraeota bacterium]
METLYVRYGTDERAMTRTLLEIMDVQESINPAHTVVIKPNLVNPTAPSEGATTHSGIVRTVIEYLLERGIHKIVIAESSWVGASTLDAFRICGYESIAREYDVPLVDLKNEGSVEVPVMDMKIRVFERILKADILINMPVLKAHCQTSMTCAMKNLKGCIPDSEKRRFHTLGIHRPVALLNRILRSHLVIVDGICGDLFFEEGGTPLPMNRIIAGRNALTMDLYCAGLIGYSFEDIEYLGIARKLGLGDGRFNVVETNTCKDSDTCMQVKETRGKRLESLTKNVVNDQACSACYGGLIQALGRMKDLPSGMKFSIGQGFKGKKLAGVGIGNCTSGFTRWAKGCPPRAIDIIDFLAHS